MTSLEEALAGQRLKTEHEAFLTLTESLALCSAAARALAQHRPDQGHAWMKMAETYSVARDAVFRLEMERVGGKQ